MSKKELVGLIVIGVVGIIGLSYLKLVFRIDQQQNVCVDDEMKKRTCLSMKESLGNSSLALHSATYLQLIRAF